MADGAGPGAAATGNHLLDALLASRRPGSVDVLVAPLEVVDVRASQVVHQPAAPVEHVLFPTSAVFGLMTVTAGTPEVEAMAVGAEGVVGLAAVLGDGTSPHRALCQVPGQAVRLPVAGLRELAETDTGVGRLLGRHAQAAVVLLSQRIACSQRHTAEQRCADWLLCRADAVGAQPVPVTQEFLAGMLGLRRTTVSAIAAQLQQAGLISYRYGRVTVRDAAGLRPLACSCYQVVQDQHAELEAAARDHASRS